MVRGGGRRWGAGGHLGLKGTVTLSLSHRGTRLNTSYFTTKTGCGLHTNEPIIGGFYHSIPSWFNLPNKQSLFPCLHVGWSLASRAPCAPMSMHLLFPHPCSETYSTFCPLISSLHVYLCFLEVSLLLLSPTHFLLLPL